MPEPTDPAKNFVEWERAHRRPGFKGQYVVTGFGDAGDVTLKIPSPKIDVRYRFVGGRATRETVESCMSEQSIVELRDRVLMSFNSAYGIFSVDVEFLNYAAAILALNYDFTDSELDDLLVGSAWHREFARHLMGGDDAAESFASYQPFRPAPLVPEPVQASAPVKPLPTRSMKNKKRKR